MTDFNTNDSNPDAYSGGPGSSGHYPTLPPIPSLLGFSLGFSEEGRRTFTEFHNVACKQYNFIPSPIEKEALTYYNGTFYGAEALGARNGVLGGGAIGLLVALKSKKPWRIFNMMGNRMGMQPRYIHAFSRGVTLFMFSQLGKIYGATSAGVAAFGQVTAQQKNDPNMQRYLKMRKEWIEKHGPLPLGKITEMKQEYDKERRNGSLDSQGGSQYDDQSLGGMDYYDEKPEPVQAAPAVNTRRVGQPRRQQQTQSEDDDPFAFGSPNDDDASPRQQKQSGESAWAKIRRGEQSANERRPQPVREEVAWNDKEASREDERARAQREFDEKLERERQGADVDAFVGESEQTRASGGYRK